MTQREAFAAAFDVPRETLARFDRYAELLAEWQIRMNLVGPSTLPQIWERHFADSAQLLPLAGTGKRWLDIGAGAGFPGLVIALLDPAARLVMVESIAKKCSFLNMIVNELDLAGQVAVANIRIEALPPQRFDIITARALAALEQLFAWGMPFANGATLWVLPKGARVADELAAARLHFAMDARLVPSCTDPDARIVLASKVKRR